MKRFWIVILVLAAIIAAGLGLIRYAVSRLEVAETVDGGVLVWEVAGNYPEETDDSFWGQVRSGGELTMREVLFSLQRAAEDPRITGLVMDMQGLDVDWAKIEELQDAVGQFGRQGKPVLAYLDGAETRDYALAAQAQQVVVSPEANLMVLGVVAELDFMKDTLQKLGMAADFIHVGKYKSAPERMTRSSASPENREMIAAIVEDRYAALVEMLALARGVETAAAAAWIDQGMFDAAGAVAAGLADTVLYWDQMMDGRFPQDPVTFLEDYALELPRGPRHSPQVAIVHVTGVIMPGESRFDNFQGKIAGSETVIEHLQAAADSPDIEAVILRVDSPGGSALASDLIWRQVEKLKADMPVIVSMSGLAASGGYYVSCGADSIFADPGTLTGSIGVYAGKLDRSQMYRKIGVNREFITRGQNALLFSDEGGFTPGQRELFQRQMDGFYERFLDKVAQGRGLDREQVHAVAQGRVWTGRQGQMHGLVDGLGGLGRALDSVKWSLGLDPSQKVSVVTFGKELSWLERMVLRSLHEGSGFGSIGLGSPGLGVPGILPDLAQTLRQDGILAAAALMDGRPVAMMPFVVRIR